MKKVFRFFILILPVVLYFSYFPIISLGKNETMNFELSLPLLWLVLFDVVAFIIMVREKKLKLVIRNWKFLLLPIFMTCSILWSHNTVRGILTAGILWLIYFAVFSFFALRELIADAEFKEKFYKVFFGSAAVMVGILILQCALDVFNIPREYSLLCEGCTSYSFGFPHPNGFAIEPQFMGNLLLAPAIVAMSLISKNKKYIFLSFVFICGIFLTFSRGAIYAFIVAMIFMTACEIVRTKKWSVLKNWVIIIAAFLFTLNLQGIFAEVSPTNDTYRTGVTKVLNHLSLGTVKVSAAEKPDAYFDGYVPESTDTRIALTNAAMETWTKDFKTVMFGVGIGGAGEAMYEDGKTESPKEIVQNEYASVLLELGIVGAVLIIFTIVMIGMKITKNDKNKIVIILSLTVAYAASLMFFSGFTNALQIYLLPAILLIM